MELSTEIYEALNHSKIPHNIGIPYILSLKFGIKDSPLFEDKLIQTMNQSGIYDIVKKKIVWLVPVFTSEVERDFTWVEKYVDAFAQKNPDRKGSVNACILRFKDFLFKNPEVTKRDIQKATKLYLESVTDPQFLVTSYYFIYKGKGKERVSLLSDYLQRVKDEENLGQGRNSLSNTMQE